VQHISFMPLCSLILENKTMTNETTTDNPKKPTNDKEIERLYTVWRKVFDDLKAAREKEMQAIDLLNTFVEELVAAARKNKDKTNYE